MLSVEDMLVDHTHEERTHEESTHEESTEVTTVTAVEEGISASGRDVLRYNSQRTLLERHGIACKINQLLRK